MSEVSDLSEKKTCKSRDTAAYYNRNAEAYFNDTARLDMAKMYKPFLETIPMNGHILDAGCGSGRDSRAFRIMGYRVTAFDASEEMVIRARVFSGVDVQQRSFDEVNEIAVYDGIWACASLLHVSQRNLLAIMSRLARSLKTGGLWYVSFKNGIGEREKEGRTFTDLNEPALKLLVESLSGISTSSAWVTTGGRPGQKATWLNALLRKDGT
jgi:2-polyprenyl-3-methyl-5-hydroxy-6-metoxy-1,4-benzoquinol methylase